MAEEGQQNNVLHQSIEIGAGIRIGDVGQPSNYFISTRACVRILDLQVQCCL